MISPFENHRVIRYKILADLAGLTFRKGTSYLKVRVVIRERAQQLQNPSHVPEESLLMRPCE